jgi:aspartate aminotransferase-like enzyme
MSNRSGSTSFGPNAELAVSFDLFGSHRDPNFRSLFEKTRDKFLEVFSLEEFDLLFLPGGGTLGIESVISSSIHPVDVKGVDGVFRTRWTEMARLYNESKTGQAVSLSCHLETSVSHFQDLGTPILDVVSSFPYYQIPESCDIFVLASNKQLNSIAGLAIVGVRKGKLDTYFRESELSYLSLRRYFDAASHDELPSTVGTYLFEVLLRSLEVFDPLKHRENVDQVCDAFVDVLGEDMFLGDLRPVLTIKQEAIPREFARDWTLYEKQSPIPSYQIFTYSAPKASYMDFLAKLEKETK